MALGKRAIQFDEDKPAARPPAQAAMPSPALALQALLERRAHELALPELGRDQLRKLLMMLAASGVALWMALIATGDAAVTLIA